MRPALPASQKQVVLETPAGHILKVPSPTYPTISSITTPALLTGAGKHCEDPMIEYKGPPR